MREEDVEIDVGAGPSTDSDHQRDSGEQHHRGDEWEADDERQPVDGHSSVWFGRTTIRSGRVATAPPT
jgi:hypothetical protein